MKKVLVIGGTGTISSPIVRGLSEKADVELYVLNRGNRNNRLPENVRIIIGDMRNNVEGVKESIKDLHFDCVINFIIMSPDDARKNVDIFTGKCDQFIFISTNVALDHRYEVAVDETLGYGNQYSMYGKSKGICEQYFLEEYRTNGFPITIVRPTQTYSEGRIPLSVKGKSYWSVCSRMLKGKEVIIHGDGQSLWAMTHADDFARFFIPLVCDNTAIGEAYQIMNPEPMTWDMIYQGLAEELGCEYKPVYIGINLLDTVKAYNMKEAIHGDKHFSNIFDISKIRAKAPEAEFSIDRRKGIHMFVEYMRNHPEEQIEDEAFDRWCDETIELYHRLEKEFADNVR